jgi:GAF domain-containing protein
MTERDLAEDLATAARELQSEKDVHTTLDKAIALCVDLIEGCEAAGVSIVHRRGIDTPATTSDAVARGDALQYELREGPCLDAVRDHELVCSGDLTTDDRWPTWGPRVAEECGARSMLCVQLYVEEDSLGALNMYSRQVNAFDDSDQAEALALAAHVAVALVAAREVESLNAAVTARTITGQAQGILMERFDIDAQLAFDVLRRVSQDNNVKLSKVAAELVDTRRTPGQ